MLRLNKVMLAGRISADPEIRNANGKAYCRFTLCVDEAKKQGEEKAECNFITCTAWEKSAEFLRDYVKKGDELMVDGRWRHRTYKKQDGSTGIMDECAAGMVQKIRWEDKAGANGTGGANGGYTQVDDDELPF